MNLNNRNFNWRIELAITWNMFCWLDIAVVRAGVHRISKRKCMKDMKLDGVWKGHSEILSGLICLEFWCFFLVFETFAGWSLLWTVFRKAGECVPLYQYQFNPVTNKWPLITYFACCVCGYFALMYIFAPCMSSAIAEVVKGHHIPWEVESQTVMSQHVDAGNQTGPLKEQPVLLTTDPFLQLSF